MIKKFIRFLVVVALLGVTIFFFVVGKIADRRLTRMDRLEDYSISSRAKSLHPTIYVSDLHADNLLWDRHMLAENSHGQVDIPRLIKGNYAIQVFDAVIKTPKGLNYQANDDKTDNIQLVAMANRWPIGTWFSLYKRALHQSKILHDAANESSSLQVIKSARDLEIFMRMRRSNSYMIGGILSVEGLHAAEGEMENIDGLIEAGYRIMGLVHLFDNDIGGSSAGLTKGGLTDFGARVIRRLESREVIVDLAHASPKLISDVLEIAKRPLLVTHTGVKGVHDSPRNLSDDEIRRVAKTGGLIGIGFWPEAIGTLHPTEIASSIRYVVDLVGIEYVGLGSDFDGAVKQSFDASQIIYVTEALIQEGFSDNEIRQIMGGNQIEFLKRNLPQN